MSSNHRVLLVAISIIRFAVTAVAIGMLGEPVAVPSPKHLTPELFDRIIAGLSQEYVKSLLPNPKPSNLIEIHGSADANGSSPSMNNELNWREFGVCGTYGTFIEFRIYFENGKVMRKAR